MIYWKDGIPYQNVNTTIDTGTTKCWFDGAPYVEIFQIESLDPIKNFSYTVFGNIKKINGVSIANIKKISNVQLTEVILDVTPNALNWNNISTFEVPSHFSYPQTPETISGINTSITLEITYTPSGLTLQYDKNSLNSWTTISSGGTLTVTNGDTLTFQMESGTALTVFTVTVKNVSNGNTTLDTFTIQYIDI